MSDQEDGKAQQTTFDWKRNPNAPTLYGNYLHIGWTLEDVRITFGTLRSETINKGEILSDEQGSAVVSWRQAKNLRDMLNRVVLGYEAVNGKIRTPMLAEALPPEQSEDNKEEVER